MKEDIRLPSLLTYANQCSTVPCLEICPTSTDPSVVKDSHSPFFVVEDSDPFFRLVKGRFRTDSGSTIKSVFLLLQRDNYASIGSKLQPVTNPAIEAAWQTAFDHYSARSDDSTLMTLSQQVGETGKLLQFQSLFFCKARGVFFHPPCPKCGRPLELCRDDHILERAGLRTFSGSANRYLFCPSCFASQEVGTYYAYDTGSFDPPWVQDRGVLIRQFGELVNDKNETAGIPCLECPESGRCYGAGGMAMSNIVPFSFYPFYMLIFDSMSLAGTDFIALVSGASLEEVEANLRGQGEMGRLHHLKDMAIRDRGFASPFLYKGDARLFLEVLYLKLSFLSQIVHSTLVGFEGSGFSYPLLSFERIWAKLTDKMTLLPYYWNFELCSIDIFREPLEVTTRPKLPTAYGLHYLGILWLQTLLVNAKHDIPTVRTAIDKAYDQLVPRYSKVTREDSSALVKSVFSPENVFWHPESIQICEAWQELWDSSISMGWALFKAALDGGAQWSAERFREEMETLREGVKRELFGSSSQLPSEVRPTDDSAIHGILTKISKRWEQSTPKPAVDPDRDAQAVTPKPEAHEPRAWELEDNEIDETVVDKSKRSEADTLPLDFKLEDDDEPVSETIIISSHKSEESIRSNRSPQGVESPGQESREARTTDSQSGSDLEVKAPATVPEDYAEYDDIPETVIVSPRKGKEAPWAAPGRAYEPLSKSKSDESDVSGSDQGAESGINDSPAGPREEDIAETIIVSPSKDRESRAPASSTSRAAAPDTHEKPRASNLQVIEEEAEPESKDKRKMAEEDDFLSETIVVTPKKDKDKA